MIELRHAGIYVDDLEQAETFYMQCFSMEAIVHRQLVSNALIDEIVGVGSKVLVSKLITPRGKMTGTGDMIELLQVIDSKKKCAPPYGAVCQTGTAHIGIGIDDMVKTVIAITENGGRQQTPILQLGNNRCCFCTDPEHNWLELIERNDGSRGNKTAPLK